MSARPELHLIAALDRRFAIGRAGRLPWHLPADLQRFKALTLGHTVLMGRRTAESIGRALPGRRNLVWTRAPAPPFSGQLVVADLANAMAITEGRLFAIGGTQVYAASLPHAEVLHLTWVETEVQDADAFFPTFDPTAWQEIGRSAHPADARHAHAFSFVDYRRLPTRG